MTKYIIRKSKLEGSLQIPSSKSETVRALLFASLANGQSNLSGVLDSPDARAMQEAGKALGARFCESEKTLLVNGIAGQVIGADKVIDAGNSGIVLRFIAGIAALGTQKIVISGDESIRQQRPMGDLLRGLEGLGASALSTRENGFAPLIIQGPWKQASTTIRGNDSQAVSALLIAAALRKGTLDLCVEEAGEKPWVDLTLSWLRRFNVEHSHKNYSEYHVIGKGAIDAFSYTVPADWSSASFPIVAALITGSDLELKNLQNDSPQGDKKILEALKSMGAVIEWREDSLWILGSQSKLIGAILDINDYVDAICILSVAACYAKGRTLISNAAIARTKECNRIECIAKELKKMGAHIEIQEDGLIIHGGKLHGTSVESHNDHRMAMSLAIAGLACEGETRINNCNCVDKTYKRFSEALLHLGAAIELIQ
jgi:3-phosphoshikimate 1-carboxyvinyltransferase